MKNFNLNIELFDGVLTISEENSTGYTYVVNNLEDVFEAIENYIESEV